ncbi:hypothetical protein C8J56DRAFT_879828 [Mycena floridula]|nr:hypothetical protein C8J56DRAFT_879828 [Mycena floridula]
MEVKVVLEIEVSERGRARQVRRPEKKSWILSQEREEDIEEGGEICETDKAEARSSISSNPETAKQSLEQKKEICCHEQKVRLRQWLDNGGLRWSEKLWELRSVVAFGWLDISTASLLPQDAQREFQIITTSYFTYRLSASWIFGPISYGPCHLLKVNSSKESQFELHHWHKVILAKSQTPLRPDHGQNPFQKARFLIALGKVVTVSGRAIDARAIKLRTRMVIATTMKQ